MITRISYEILYKTGPGMSYISCGIPSEVEVIKTALQAKYLGYTNIKVIEHKSVSVDITHKMEKL